MARFSRKQAIAQINRHKTRARRDPGSGLFQTHFFDVPTPLITVDSFPDRTKPITLQTEIILTGGTPEGFVFELGNISNGFACWIVDDLIHIGAGRSANFDQYTQCDHQLPWLAAQEGRFTLTVSANPSSGAVRAWANGKRFCDDSSPNANFGDPSTWAGGGNGSFASLFQTAYFNPDGTVWGESAPVNFQCGPLKVYNNQLPRIIDINFGY